MTTNVHPMTLTLEKVARRLDDVGIVWAVFAGAAASVYGVTRTLTDVDILVPSAEGDRMAALFPDARMKRGDDGTIRAVQLPDVDIVAGATTMDLDDEMAKRLTHHEIAGVVVPVIPPEDNILLKAMWGRGSEVGKHDWQDVQEMLAYLPALDWEYLYWRVKSCQGEYVLERLVTMRTKQRKGR